jgi:predicted ABC-type ATPase
MVERRLDPALHGASPFDSKPLIVTIAGPNGAGKSTFHEAFLEQTGLYFVNADRIAQAVGIGAYEASQMAELLCHELVAQRESFIFETVFSDPVGAKVAFLTNAQSQGYTVLLCFIGLESADLSDERVAMRVQQGGNDVPPDKIVTRYPRSLANLQRAITALQWVWVYDNSNLASPFRKLAEYENGKRVFSFPPLPGWLER